MPGPPDQQPANQQDLRAQLTETIRRLPADRLPAAAEALRILLNQPASPPCAGNTPSIKDWPHAPLHRLSEHGTYIVTTGTYQKHHIFRDPDKLTLLQATLLSLARKHECHLEAWAVFSNHYHFVAHCKSSPLRLRELISELHATTSREVNRLDNTAGRQVWHNYRDTQLTYERSYLARLNYVHQNAVKHGLTRVANQYPWCSAAWFERVARPAQVKTIYSFKTDRLRVPDEFDPLPIP